MPSLKKVLAIDGGGIRGLIPAIMLAEIEKRTGRRIADLFDVVAGTSTGGLLALGLTLPGLDGRPRYSAQDMVDLYWQEGSAIFSSSLRYRLMSVWGLAAPRYPSRSIESVLRSYFGQHRLKECLSHVIVTAYEITQRETFFFRSHRAGQNEAYDFAMADVARATSAAPSFFKPKQVRAGDGKVYTLVDGGLSVSNPAMAAYIDVKLRWNQPDCDVLLLSLGTGEYKESYAYPKMKNWGMLESVVPLIEMMAQGGSEVTSFYAEQFLRQGCPDRYFRFQVDLQRNQIHLDCVKPNNLRALKQAAESYIEKHSDLIDSVCHKLLGKT